MLDIYLDEAGEVLGNIQAALVECRAQPQDLDVLTTIRRGFHTLKGSGRMVGLMDLGEVAWEVEQVMNRWLQMKWPASAELLDLLARASASFAGWIAQLRDGSLTAEIKAQDIVGACRQAQGRRRADGGGAGRRAGGSPSPIPRWRRPRCRKR